MNETIEILLRYAEDIRLLNARCDAQDKLIASQSRLIDLTNQKIDVIAQYSDKIVAALVKFSDSGSKTNL